MDSIEITKTIDAQPESVFRALTDADELTRWWPTGAESDPRSGGAFEYRFEFSQEPERNHVYSGTYYEISPNRRLAYPWQGKLGETRVEVTVEPAHGGTEVRLVHSGLGDGEEWVEWRQLHLDGWSFFLDNLKAYLERGEDRRADVLGMKVKAAV